MLWGKTCKEGNTLKEIFQKSETKNSLQIKTKKEKNKQLRCPSKVYNIQREVSCFYDNRKTFLQQLKQNLKT